MIYTSAKSLSKLQKAGSAFGDASGLYSHCLKPVKSQCWAKGKRLTGRDLKRSASKCSGTEGGAPGRRVAGGPEPLVEEASLVSATSPGSPAWAKAQCCHCGWSSRPREAGLFCCQLEEGPRKEDCSSPPPKMGPEKNKVCTHSLRKGLIYEHFPERGICWTSEKIAQVMSIEEKKFI